MVRGGPIDLLRIGLPLGVRGASDYNRAMLAVEGEVKAAKVPEVAAAVDADPAP